MKILQEIKRYLQRKRYLQPKYIKDVWWNMSVHSRSTKYPKVFKDGKYIECKKGLSVLMNITGEGWGIYYEVIKIRYAQGSDWLYDSDAIYCDLKFSHIDKTIST